MPGGEHIEGCDGCAALHTLKNYDGPGADAIKHDLALLVMERAGLK